MFAARRRRQRRDEGGILQPEIQKARTRDFHRLAHIAQVQLRENVAGQLARVEFARLRQCHERRALIIAKLRVRTRAHEHGGRVGVRQHGADGQLQTLFDLFVGQHGLY